MAHLLWIIPLVMGLAAMYQPKLLSVALLAMLVCGLVGIVRLFFGTEGSSLVRSANEDRSEQNRDPLAVQQDVPPPS